jgi:hypothetical protein
MMNDVRFNPGTIKLVSAANDDDEADGMVEAEVLKELSSCLGNEAFRFKSVEDR